MYEGDFILRISTSCEVKNKNKSVHLITYSLLTDFKSVFFFENGTSTTTNFYKTYHAKCKLKYGMASEDIIACTVGRRLCESSGRKF